MATNVLVPPEIEDCWIYVVPSGYLSKPNSIGGHLTMAMAWLVAASTSQYPESLVVVDGGKKRMLHHHLYDERSSLVCLPKADKLVPVVSAASIIAKVFRDELMLKAAEGYPGYDFKHNKGYGTTRHRKGMQKHGPCVIHRFGVKAVAYAFRDLEEAGKMRQHGHPGGEEREAERSEGCREGVRGRSEGHPQEEGSTQPTDTRRPRRFRKLG